MKKILSFLFCVLVSVSCSLGDFVFDPLPSATPLPSSTSTFTLVPSPTPITPTATFTYTPTLIGWKTATNTLEPSPTIVTETPTLFTPNTATATVQMDGFVSILTSSEVLYRSRSCSPPYVIFTAQVANAQTASQVVLFARFTSKSTGNSGEWSNFNMDPIGGGTFSYDLYADQVKGDELYREPWLEYQFIAVTSNLKEVGRTATFKNRITMLECVPTPTPLSTGTTP